MRAASSSRTCPTRAGVPAARNRPPRALPGHAGLHFALTAPRAASSPSSRPGQVNRGSSDERERSFPPADGPGDDGGGGGLASHLAVQRAEREFVQLDGAVRLLPRPDHLGGVAAGPAFPLEQHRTRSAVSTKPGRRSVRVIPARHRSPGFRPFTPSFSPALDPETTWGKYLLTRSVLRAILRYRFLFGQWWWRATRLLFAISSRPDPGAPC